MNSPPPLLPPPLVVNHNRVRTAATAAPPCALKKSWMRGVRRMSSEFKKKNRPNVNSPPLLLPPPLVINRDRVRTIAAAPLPPRSVKIALCKNQAARVGCCVFFVFLSLVFFWSVGKKRSFPKEFFLYLNVKFYVGISGINRGNFVRHRSIRTEST